MYTENSLSLKTGFCTDFFFKVVMCKRCGNYECGKIDGDKNMIFLFVVCKIAKKVLEL